MRETQVLSDIEGVGVVTNVVVTTMAVSGVKGVGEVAVIEVAEIEVFVGAVISVVAMVTIGMNVAWVLGNVVIEVDKGVKEGTDSVVGASGENRRILMADVKVLVVTGIEAVHFGELTVFMGATDDVVLKEEVISVVRDCIQTSSV